METIPAVLLERHEGWAEIVLNRPDRRNAIDGARGPAIPADVSTTAMRVIYDCLVENPVVR